MLRMEELVGKIQAEARERQRTSTGGVNPQLLQPVGGADKDPNNRSGYTDQKIAEAAGVSRETVRRVRRVEENAVQPIKDLAFQGEISSKAMVVASNVTPFDFRGSKVRVIEINGEPWFVAKDACVVLEIATYQNAYARLDKDEKTNVRRIDVGMGYGRPVVLVSEPGLYKLVMQSRKPEAQEFLLWAHSLAD